MSAITKEDLHRLIDALPASDLPVAHRVLEALTMAGHEEAFYSLEDAPLDEEPTTPDEDAGVVAAHAAISRGDLVSAEEAKRLLLS
jgi:hypothetical protein